MSFISAVEAGFKQVKDKERNYFKITSGGIAIVKKVAAGETEDGVPFISFRFQVESSDDAVHYPGEVLTRGFLLDAPGWKNRTRLAEVTEIMETLKPGFRQLDPEEQAKALKADADSSALSGLAVRYSGVQKIGKKTKLPATDKKGNPVVDVKMELLPQTDAELASRLAALGSEDD